MIQGREYRQQSSPQILIYPGADGVWHEFARVEEPEKIWVGLPESDLNDLCVIN